MEKRFPWLLLILCVAIGTCAWNLPLEGNAPDSRILYKSPVPTQGQPESAWQRWFERESGGKPRTLPDGSRVDVVTDKVAWEIDRAEKWKEGIGQALLYGILTNKTPGLMLFAEKRDQSSSRYYLRAKLVSEKYGIKLRFEYALHFEE